MQYRFSGRAFFGVRFVVFPAMLLLLLAAIFGGAAAVDTVPDARVKTAVEFLAANGWTVDPVLCDTAEVVIPEQFGTVYENYNALQLAQGFDLTPCRGAVLTRFTFPVSDPPDDVEGPVLANVFFEGGTIVAADLCAVGLNGFIRGVIGE